MYAGCTAHHRAHDAVVLADARLEPGARVLDLGCGTGDLTARVAALVRPGGSVVGLDASASSVAHARRVHADAGAAWVVALAQDVGAVLPPDCVDVVLSVATLHWVPAPDLPGVLAGVRAVLAAGGRLRVDMGGDGQIAAARAVLDPVAARHGGGPPPFTFPRREELAGLVERAGLDVVRLDRLVQRRSFPDAASCGLWLRSQVLPAYLPSVPVERRQAFEDDAVAACARELRRADGSYDQEYVRLDLVADAP